MVVSVKGWVPQYDTPYGVSYPIKIMQTISRRVYLKKILNLLKRT